MIVGRLRFCELPSDQQTIIVMAKTATSKKTPKVHKDLQGFDLHINAFGEITTSLDIDRLNDFLNKNVDDKKLREREEA